MAHNLTLSTTRNGNCRITSECFKYKPCLLSTVTSEDMATLYAHVFWPKTSSSVIKNQECVAIVPYEVATHANIRKEVLSADGMQPFPLDDCVVAELDAAYVRDQTVLFDNVFMCLDVMDNRFNSLCAIPLLLYPILAQMCLSNVHAYVVRFLVCMAFQVNVEFGCDVKTCIESINEQEFLASFYAQLPMALKWLSRVDAMDAVEDARLMAYVFVVLLVNNIGLTFSCQTDTDVRYINDAVIAAYGETMDAITKPHVNSRGADCIVRAIFLILADVPDTVNCVKYARWLTLSSGHVVDKHWPTAYTKNSSQLYTSCMLSEKKTTPRIQPPEIVSNELYKGVVTCVAMFERCMKRLDKEPFEMHLNQMDEKFDMYGPSLFSVDFALVRTFNGYGCTYSSDSYTSNVITQSSAICYSQVGINGVAITEEGDIVRDEYLGVDSAMFFFLLGAGRLLRPCVDNILKFLDLS